MKKDSLIRSTSLFSLATLMSRMLGLVRDSCIAATIPTAWQDIFWAGIKIPSTFRQLFAEGALSAAFIPLLTRVREREGEAEAKAIGQSVFNLLSLTLFIVVAVAIVLSPWLVPYVLDFPDAEDGTIDWRYSAAIHVTQMMFPFLFFIALSAWAMGVLNSYRHFFVPALASAFFNLSLITGCLIGALWLELEGMTLMTVLAASVIFGGFLQYAVQIGPLKKEGYFPPRWVSPIHEKTGQFLRMLAPSVFGLAIYQINALITQTYFASKFGEGGISQMQYAHRLIQFPLGVVGVALATASFPRIAQEIEQHKHDDAARTLTLVIKYLMMLMIPAAVGLSVLGVDIVGLIFNRGEFFSHGALMPTYSILVAYCSGLLAYALLKVTVRTMQAHHDFKTPVIIGGASVALNIALCAMFVKSGWPLWSLGFASAIASSAHALILLLILWKRMSAFHLLPLLGFFARVLLASGGMAAACWGIMLLIPFEGSGTFTYGIRVLVGMMVGLLSYAVFALLLYRGDVLAIAKRK